jgi:hypothetical protein
MIAAPLAPFLLSKSQAQSELIGTRRQEGSSLRRSAAGLWAAAVDLLLALHTAQVGEVEGPSAVDIAGQSDERGRVGGGAGGGAGGILLLRQPEQLLDDGIEV